MVKNDVFRFPIGFAWEFLGKKSKNGQKRVIFGGQNSMVSAIGPGIPKKSCFLGLTLAKPGKMVIFRVKTTKNRRKPNIPRKESCSTPPFLVKNLKNGRFGPKWSKNTIKWRVFVKIVKKPRESQLKMALLELFTFCRVAIRHFLAKKASSIV